MKKYPDFLDSTTGLAQKYKLPIKAFDFFSGCGGGSKGFQNAGMEIILAIDNDFDAGETFKKNFSNSHFLLKDIKELTPDDLQSYKMIAKEILYSFRHVRHANLSQGKTLNEEIRMKGETC